jgi:LuxR family maltose regulon positive regulatory protein
VLTFLVPLTRARLLLALVRLGETERAEQVLAGLGEQDRQRGEISIVIAVLRLAQHDPHAATGTLAPVLDGSAAPVRETWLVEAFVLEAIARDALGDPAAAERALKRALDLAEPGGAHLLFLLQPAPGLLERHVRHQTRHATLIAEILDLLPDRHGRAAVHGELAPSRARADAGGPALRLTEPLSKSEIRVLRYLPTNLSAPEIARELSLSVHTVRTHVRHLFAKLGAHGRTEAVERARGLGLLAPSPSRRAS